MAVNNFIYFMLFEKVRKRRAFALDVKGRVMNHSDKFIAFFAEFFGGEKGEPEPLYFTLENLFVRLFIVGAPSTAHPREPKIT